MYNILFCFYAEHQVWESVLYSTVGGQQTRNIQVLNSAIPLYCKNVKALPKTLQRNSKINNKKAQRIKGKTKESAYVSTHDNKSQWLMLVYM